MYSNVKGPYKLLPPTMQPTHSGWSILPSKHMHNMLFALGHCIVSRYIGCIDTLAMIHNVSFIFVTWYFKQYIFAYIYVILVIKIPKFPWNLWTYQDFWSKTRQIIFLIHIKYRFMCIMICIISHKINDKKPTH